MKRTLKYKNYKAPYIDMLIKSAQADPIVKCSNCQKELMVFIKEMSKLKIQGYDELRSIWIEADRGKINNGGIQLTPVATICSILDYGRLSPNT